MSVRRRKIALWAVTCTVAVVVLVILVMISKPDPEVSSHAATPDAITSILNRTIDKERTPVSFADVTQQSGIAMQHLPGGRRSLLPEDMGSGIAWPDFDDDGDPDLFVVNFTRDGESGHSRLFANDGGQFADISSEVGLAQPARGLGAAWGDFDNDGDLDLYLTIDGPNRLYRNDNGYFSNIAELAGVDDPSFGAGASWGDYDGDGWIDLYVCNYVKFAANSYPDSVQARQYESVIPVTLNPSAYPAAANRLYRNLGDGTFAEVARQAGVSNPSGRSLGAVWMDFNNDRLIDLYVANDVSDNGVFLNQGDGTFADIGAQSLAADYRGAMGLAVADYDRDQDLDIFVTHWLAQENALFQNMFSENWSDDQGRRRLFFMDGSDLVGLGQSSIRMVGWATSFADFDNDGELDLWVVNGNTIEGDNDRSRLKPQQLQLYWQQADKGFFEIAHPLPEVVGRGGAQADYDLDGRVDIALLAHAEGPILLRNESTSKGNWIAFDLRQHGLNRFALGARISVESSEAEYQLAQVGTGVSYLSQNEHIVRFGLGSVDQTQRVKIDWPDGQTTVLDHVAINQVIKLVHKPKYPHH